MPDSTFLTWVGELARTHTRALAATARREGLSPTDALDAVIEVLPAMKTPTVNELYGSAGYAVETVVPKNEINILIPALKDAGATDIIELPLSKIVH